MQEILYCYFFFIGLLRNFCCYFLKEIHFWICFTAFTN
uniref:Uncharacterized protein n=1 Tax=Rhizophora mucronata TaxID=61149 RepID=A0A2P2Q1Q6_RHIMU